MNSESKNPKIKICGMTNPDNVSSILKLNPDYLGFIFYDKSKRFINSNAEYISKLNINKVGVFVNSSLDEIVKLQSQYNFKYVQLHGDEDLDFCKSLKNKSNLKIIKAFRIKDNSSLESIKEFQDISDYFLFDTYTENYGGSGKSFNWDLLENYQLDRDFFLSGGINSNNFNLAYKFAKNSSHCHALDLNSGYEIQAGIKSYELLEKSLGNRNE